MGGIIFILVIFIVFVGGGWLIGRSIGGLFERKSDNYEELERSSYVDNSVHYNVHNHEHIDKKITHNHEHTHQNLTVIDEETHARGLGHFSNKKDSR